MSRFLKLIFVGNRFEGSTSMQRLRAFERLGHRVSMVVTGDGFRKPSSLWRRVRHRLGLPCEFNNENAELLACVSEFAPDIVWIEKGLTLKPSTLRAVRERCPECRIVSYSADDMMNPRNQSRYWRACIALYDAHVTTKTHNIEELRDAGARQVVFTPKSFDPDTHRPMNVTAEDRERFGAPVGFIGSYEEERAESIRFLGDHGVPVRIWGTGWERFQPCPPSVRVEGQALYGDDYAMVINTTDINLCFLRKMNRDQQTARSIEIPACGAFMLAERTDEHLELFDEGREAEFFGSDQELRYKVREYLNQPTKRSLIAQAGRERCIRGEYGHASRLRQALREIINER